MRALMIELYLLHKAPPGVVRWSRLFVAETLPDKLRQHYEICGTEAGLPFSGNRQGVRDIDVLSDDLAAVVPQEPDFGSPWLHERILEGLPLEAPRVRAATQRRGKPPHRRKKLVPGVERIGIAVYLGEQYVLM